VKSLNGFKGERPLSLPSERAPDRGFDALLEAARSGDKEAQGRLLETCRRPLLYFARRQLNPDLRAKGGSSDVVQDAFVNALREIDAFEGCTPEQLLHWMHAITRHSLANFERQYSSGKRWVARESPLEETRVRVDARDAGPSPSEVVMRRERAETVERALARLPEAMAQVVRLRQEGKRSFEEIGRQIGRTGAAARHLWLRAVAELGLCLEAEGERRGSSPSAGPPG
jgi:RNA polymerase sigma-70 factor (subfamily 1)